MRSRELGLRGDSRRVRRRTCARTRSRCRASRSSTHGSRRRTKAGCATRSRRWACRSRTCRRSGSRSPAARSVRRRALSACRARPATSIVNGRPMVGPAIPWKKTAAHAEPRHDRFDRRHPARAGPRWAGRAAALRGTRWVARHGRQHEPRSVDFGFTPRRRVVATPRAAARAARCSARRRSTLEPDPLRLRRERVFPVYFNRRRCSSGAGDGRAGRGGRGESRGRAELADPAIGAG